MPLNHRQVMSLQQKLSPQQIQMIKLLELPVMQLEQRVKQEIEDNIVLEEFATPNDDLQPGEEGEQLSDEKEPQQISVDEYLREDETPSYKSRVNNHSKDDKERPLFISGGRSLQEYLVEQLGYRELSERQMQLSTFIVGCLDEDGYLRRDLDTICDDLAFLLNIECDESELESILSIIQQLEPVGIGARNVRECLLLQIDDIAHPTPSQITAKRILAHHFEEFAKRHFEKLLTQLHLSEDQFRAAVSEIKRLSPKPSNQYSEGGSESTPYITPDFLLSHHDDQFELTLNSGTLPEVKISPRYIDMIRDMVGSNGELKSGGDREAIQFVKSKIDSAKWFISAIKQRHDTLTRTMETILAFQHEYFLDGDPSHLRPMILKDIAERTGLDVSTISRVVNSKYVQTHFGTILLKSLFSEGMQTESGEEVSSHEVKSILQQCIDDENKRRPLTDEVLMDILNAKGYRIARRTVAKYREMLGIPVARLRKQI